MNKQPISKTAMRKAGGPAKNPPVKTTGTSTVKAAMPKPDRMWEVKSAMDTLMRADELRGDKRLMADVKAMANAQAKKMQKIC